jgi:hypothetical protein
VDPELAAGQRVLDAHARGPAGLLDQLGHAAAVGHHRAEPLRLAQHGQHQAHVVGLAVVEEVAGGRLAALERRQQATDLLGVDDAVAVGAPLLEVGLVAGPPAQAGQPQPVGRHDVVHVQPDAHRAVGPLALEVRDDQRQRPHQVRRQVDEQRALEQRLAHQSDVEVLEVAQAAVDELGRPARGPRRVVLGVDQRNAVPARRRVERHARAGDPAADHHHVEAIRLERSECVVARDHGRYVT